MIKTFSIGALLLLSILGIKLGFSNYAPWINQPEQSRSVPKIVQLGTGIKFNNTGDDSIVLAVSMSGGGTRAGAFAYGVLEALKETKIHWDRQQKDLFQEIDLISGVSAGSILAAYTTAFGTNTFPAFKEKFLYKDFQSTLITSALSPQNLVKLSSPNYGRGNLLVEKLDLIFEGKKFEDLPVRPRLLITATDLSKARGFQFTPEQFTLICSDLRSVPLAFAAGASSSVPFLFSPIAVKNYSGSVHCPNKATIHREIDWELDFRTQHLYKDKLTYLDSENRPFIHLVDGAVSDNLGLRSIIDRPSVSGDLNTLITRAPPRSVRRLIFIVINAEIDPLENIDQSEESPDLIKVASAIRFSKGLRTSAETLEILHQAASNWQEQLKNEESNNSESIFTADSQLHIVQVNLREVPDPVQRKRLLALPTVFQLPREDVDDLILAGKQTLFASPAFKNLMESLEVDE